MPDGAQAAEIREKIPLIIRNFWGNGFRTGDPPILIVGKWKSHPGVNLGQLGWKYKNVAVTREK